MSFKKENRRKRIHKRIRKKVQGTAQRPRLSVYRSNRDIYAQLIDDVSGHTLLSASSREKDVANDVPKVEQAKQVGKILGERIQASKIDAIVFDRGGYLYHGRVKALAEGIREAGIQI